MIRSLLVLSISGTGNVFHDKVLENLRSDFRRPPIVRCQVINIEEDNKAKRSPDESSIVKALSLVIISGEYCLTVK